MVRMDATQCGENDIRANRTNNTARAIAAAALAPVARWGVR